MLKTLPDVKSPGIIPEYFPTKMQAFIFRNWEMVSKEKIAEVLETSVDNVVKEAKRMGLPEQGDTNVWYQKGYITIIRSNWHLLPYEQLLTLLGWDAEKLSRILKEEDFLDVKMGFFKPDCEKIMFKPLNDAEVAQTVMIKTAVEQLRVPENSKNPFDFWSNENKTVTRGELPMNHIALFDSWCIENLTNDEIVAKMIVAFKNRVKHMWDLNLEGTNGIKISFVQNVDEEYHKIVIDNQIVNIYAGASAGVLRAFYRIEDMMSEAKGPYLPIGEYERKPRFGARYIYPFCALYEGAFDVDSASYCPDALLEQYARTGVNGIWLQAVLYRMIKFPFDEKMSDGWEVRQNNLRNLVNRAKVFGIKVYLYINEPRTMPLAFFDKYPDMKGAECGKFACMCFSSEKVRNYLRDSIEELCRSVPGLGGFFTITMSENLTHCKSRNVDVACEHCRDVEVWKLAAQANSLIAEGAYKADPNIKVIAWDWAWDENGGFNPGDQAKCMQAITHNVAIMTKRETEIEFSRGGFDGIVHDYAMSVEGISPISLERWRIAKDAGLETAVKLQLNNTWECSTVPYMPVYDMLIRQMDGLIDANVNHLMLSWTLGGYPSPSIRFLSEAFFSENGKAPDYKKQLRVMYGEDAEKIANATKIFCEAFLNFPFDIKVLYMGPQNAGVSNPLYSEPTNYKATMTCYAYDDLESWRSYYSEEVFEKQFCLLSERWEEGLHLLQDDASEFYDMAYVAYSLFKSSYNQIRFVRMRNQFLTNCSQKTADEIVSVVKDEKNLTLKVYEIMCRRPSVGFEAANHYYFSKQMLAEKIVNCEFLLEKYAEAAKS